MEQFRSYRPDVSAYAYEAGHGFDCDQHATYDEGAAREAMQRTLLWISQYVQGQAPVALKNAGAYLAGKPEKKERTASGDLGPPLH